MNKRPTVGAAYQPRNRWELAFLALLLVLSLVVAALIFRFFWRPAVYAAVVGIGFYPVHARIAGLLKRKNLAALVSTFVVLSILIIGAVFLASTVSDEITPLARYLSDKASHSGGIITALLHLTDRLVAWLNRYVDLDRTGLRSAIDALPSKASQILLGTAAAIVKGLAGFLAQGAITVFILFFVFRDGVASARRVAALLPVEPRRVSRMYTQIRDNVFANLYGMLAVALAQGFLTGVAFAVLGIPSPALSGIVAGFCSLIPIIGPALVWVPGAIFLFSTGHWLRALILLAWGGLVVGTADNVVRPLVIMGRVRFHPLILLFALIGGVEEFGFVGLFIGPVVTSIIVALVEMLQQEIRQSKDESADLVDSSS